MNWDGLSPPYATIVADPPWSYRSARPTARWTRWTTAESHFATMSMAEIAALPVGDLAANDAYLLLWVTNPRLFGDRNNRGQGIGPVDILEGWGFRYVTMVTWVKLGTLGMGYHFRGDTEHVLVGVRGKARIPPEHRPRNVIVAHKGRHSQKPAAFYDVVEQACPGPYVELFARQPRLGWDSWGHGYEHLAPPAQEVR